MPADSSIQQDKELRAAAIKFIKTVTAKDAREPLAYVNDLMTLIQARDKEIARKARIDELHKEAKRFSDAGHNGLPPGFQKRMRQLSS